MQLLIAFVLFICFQSLDCRDSARQMASRLNYFDTDLLKFSAEDRKGNVMVSPVSIKSTLAMLLEGAMAATQEEIRSALRLSPNKEEFREQLNTYLSSLQTNTTGTVLENANAVFASKKLKIKKEYATMLQNVYMSELVKMDFDHPDLATQAINSWVSKKTRGHIPAVVELVHVNPLSEILITNAVYFKSAWQHAFDPQMTRADCFHFQGRCKNIAMMELHAELNYAYVDNLRAHALELPYQGGHYSMILLVPQERDGCVSLIRDLPYMSLPEIYKLMEPTDVKLSMPKFTVDYSEDMVGPLRSMRITSLFSATANLSGIFEGGSPQINSIFHRVHMMVDENGTVAAGATAAMVIPLIESGVQLRVDRPFVFFIRDNKRGLVLFEGKIEEPTPYVELNELDNKATKGRSSFQQPRRRGVQNRPPIFTF